MEFKKSAATFSLATPFMVIFFLCFKLAIYVNVWIWLFFIPKIYLHVMMFDWYSLGLTGSASRKDMSREIKDKVCDGLEYLYGRADFWRQQKPMYARKKQKRSSSSRCRGGKEPEMDIVIRNLEDIDDGEVIECSSATCKNYMFKFDFCRSWWFLKMPILMVFNFYALFHCSLKTYVYKLAVHVYTGTLGCPN